MVTSAGAGQILQGPGRSGKMDTVYLLFNNARNGWFMLVVDTNTGQSTQYNAPGAQGMVKSQCVAPDGRIYVGTVGGRLFVFDPAQPEAGVTDLGQVCKGEGYLFGLTGAPDNRLYMGSYPGAKLLCYDPASGTFTDHGRVVDNEQYSLYIAPCDERFIYVGVGVVRPRILRVDLKTGKREDVQFPEGFEDREGTCSVFRSADGRICSRLGATDTYCCVEGTHMTVVDRKKLKPIYYYNQTAIPNLHFSCDWDARTLRYRRADGSKGVWRFDYHGATSGLFAVNQGMDGTLYGSSFLPLHLFSFDPKTGQAQNLGDPFPNAGGGQVYSILAHSPTQVYFGAYAKADLIVYDPTRPWQTSGGKAAKEGTNPISLGKIGEEQCRPYSMIDGPDGQVYIATTATYGKTGGAVTKLDPKTNAWQVHRHCIRNHGIGVLSPIAGEGRLIAGGSMSMATGHPPGVFGEPQLFLWDTAQDKVVYQTPPPVAGMWYILQLQTTEDGLLVGTCGKNYKELHLFVFDPKKREFLSCKDVSETTGGYIYEGTGLTRAHQGKMYFTTPGRILSVDVKTFDVRLVAACPGATKCGVLCRDPTSDKRLVYYFLAGVDLRAMRLNP